MEFVQEVEELLFDLAQVGATSGQRFPYGFWDLDRVPSIAALGLAFPEGGESGEDGLAVLGRGDLDGKGGELRLELAEEREECVILQGVLDLGPAVGENARRSRGGRLRGRRGLGSGS